VRSLRQPPPPPMPYLHPTFPPQYVAELHPATGVAHMPIHRFMHLLCPLLCAIGAWRGQVVWELRRRLLRRLQPPLWRWEHGSVTVNCQLPPPLPTMSPVPSRRHTVLRMVFAPRPTMPDAPFWTIPGAVPALRFVWLGPCL
jgi:hypothetical protein